MADHDKRQLRNLFETRSHAWQQVGLAREITRRAARRAKFEVLVLLPLLVGVLVVFGNRQTLLRVGGPHQPSDTAVRLITVIALVILGWWIARDVGRALGPALFRRMDPATAGTVGFVIRLVTIAVVVVEASHIAGLSSRTIAVGGAFTAVVLGLAAQQTLGNLIAGTVLLSARPFRVGERVRLQGGPLAGQIEGVVSSLGLLYTTFAVGDDPVMVPNSVVLNVAVSPLREPESVRLRARLRPGVTPASVQGLLEDAIHTPLRGLPRVTLEELDGDEVVVLIEATPMRAADGPQLASEMLEAVSSQTRQPASGAAG
jgi:small-conductance mechanosensitive channel